MSRAEGTIVSRREPVMKVSMNVRLQPLVRCTFDEAQGLLRVTLKEPIEGSQQDQVVVYAMKVSVRAFCSMRILPVSYPEGAGFEGRFCRLFAVRPGEFALVHASSCINVSGRLAVQRWSHIACSYLHNLFTSVYHVHVFYVYAHMPCIWDGVISGALHAD